MCANVSLYLLLVLQYTVIDYIYLHSVQFKSFINLI